MERVPGVQVSAFNGVETAAHPNEHAAAFLFHDAFPVTAERTVRSSFELKLCVLEISSEVGFRDANCVRQGIVITVNFDQDVEFMEFVFDARRVERPYDVGAAIRRFGLCH